MGYLCRSCLHCLRTLSAYAFQDADSCDTVGGGLIEGEERTGQQGSTLGILVDFQRRQLGRVDTSIHHLLTWLGSSILRLPRCNSGDKSGMIQVRQEDACENALDIVTSVHASDQGIKFSIFAS